MNHRKLLATVILLVGALGAPGCQGTRFRLATFSTDVTVPLGHRLMGMLPTKSKTIADPLYARGFVLLGPGKPIVLAAVDFCEIRNDSYDRWRQVLADAAGTTRERVLVASLHQHDAPLIDAGAQELMSEVGLVGEIFDTEFHDSAVQRTAEALRRGLEKPVRITHLGIGEAPVEKVASNRRVVLPDGTVRFSRSSSSGGNPLYRDAPVGLIDPQLKTISFWDGDRALLAMHCYATHPMSYYGDGEVSADFIGMARDRRGRDDPGVFQIYVTGCGGDITAGKFNDRSRENRGRLADRLYQGMVEAWKKTERHALGAVAFRHTKLEVEFIKTPEFSEAALTKTLRDSDAKMDTRIAAAMGLSTRKRLAAGHKIDLPCVDFGPAQMVLLPGETFVGYQLAAQRMRPDSFVMAVGYGECWTGYLPSAAADADGFGHDSWRWVAEGSEERVLSALKRVLVVPGKWRGSACEGRARLLPSRSSNPGTLRSPP